MRRHDWVVVTRYSLTDDSALQVYRAQETGVPSDPPIVLNETNRVGEPLVGCYVCEQPLQDAWGKKCPGEPVVAP